jgi:hypothetical protein
LWSTSSSEFTGERSVVGIWRTGQTATNAVSELQPAAGYSGVGFVEQTIHFDVVHRANCFTDFVGLSVGD